MDQIEDIEDLGRTEVSTEGRTRKTDYKVKQKMRKLKGKERLAKQDEGSDCEVDFEQQDKPSLPGAQTIFVKTYGCSHNISDSEFMMGQLVDYGYQLCNDMDSSDLVLINSCTVKNPSQQSFIGLVEQAKQLRKPVVVAGCVPQGDRSIEQIDDVSIIGVTQIDRVVEVVEETLKGNKVQLLAKGNLPSLDLPKIRKNKFIEMYPILVIGSIPVNGGCLGACTYCKTKHARGKLLSYQVSALQQRVQQVVKQGVKQIWLTSEDTGAYGRDIGSNISELLKTLVESLPDDVMLRIGMTNPPYILEHLHNISVILNHPRVFSFLHIPVQSGSNSVLEKMNREYTREEFELVCDYLISNCPGITIATDIICGFPGETEAEFDETMSLIDKYKFRVLNISQFYSRPGTAAALMKKCNTKDVKQRSQRLTKLFDNFDRWSHLVGTLQRVWIHEKEEKHGKLILIGHTKTYAKVVLPYEADLFGASLLIKVEKACTWHIEGSIIERNPHPESIPIGYWKNFTMSKQSATEDKVKRILNQQDEEEKVHQIPAQACNDGCSQAGCAELDCSNNTQGCCSKETQVNQAQGCKGSNNCNGNCQCGNKLNKEMKSQQNQLLIDTNQVKSKAPLVTKTPGLLQNNVVQTVLVVVAAFVLKEVLAYALRN